MPQSNAKQTASWVRVQLTAEAGMTEGELVLRAGRVSVSAARTERASDMTERSLSAALKAVADEIQNHSEVNWGVAVQRAAMTRWAYALRLLALSIPAQGIAEVAVEDSRWQEAFEALHARILRDLPGDGSELAPPDDKFWAAQLDALLAYADELYRETEPGTVPAAADKQRS